MAHNDQVRSAEDRLRFAVEFAQFDLSTFTSEQWLRLGRELKLFVSGRLTEEEPGASLADLGGMAFHIWKGPDPLECPREVIQQMQEDTRRIIGRLIEGRDRGPLETRYWFPQPNQLNVSLTIMSARHWAVPEEAYLEAFGSLRDMFLLQLFFLLQGRSVGSTNRAGLSKIRRCSECQTLFYRVRRQEYCSHTCRTRVNQRRWRASPRGREARRLQARRRYELIGRNPRRKRRGAGRVSK